MALYGGAKAPIVPANADGTTVAALTDNSGGTADQTLAAVKTLTISAAYSQAEIQALRDAVADDIADLALKISDLIDHLNDGRTS